MPNILPRLSDNKSEYREIEFRQKIPKKLRMPRRAHLNATNPRKSFFTLAQIAGEDSEIRFVYLERKWARFNLALFVLPFRETLLITATLSKNTHRCDTTAWIQVRAMTR